MCPKSLILLLMGLFVEDFAAACTHQLAAKHGYVKKRAPQPDSVNVRRAQSTPVAVTNVKYFTGSGLSGLSTVEFRNGIITAIFPGGAGIPPGYQTVNGNGGTLLPGFIESHTHPTNLAELGTLTSYGITTSLGMGCGETENCNALRKQTGLSDFYSAGIAGCAPGSDHAILLAYPPQDLIYNTSEASAWVKARISEGSNYIKLIAEDNPGLTTAEHTAFVQAAHQQGKKTATHAAQLDNYQQAITSNTDNIQHAPLDGVLTAAQIAQIKSQGQTVTPTLTVLRNLALSPLDPVGGTYANAQANVRAIHAAGITILVGTDSDDVLGPYAPAFGSSFYDELENLVQVGFTPIQALNAGTSIPASVYGFGDRGSISPGKRADLILVSGDPTTNVSNARNIQKVWVTGINYTPVA